MGFQLDVAYVDIILREQQANRQLETFRQTTVRKSQQTARESSGAFETILFGKMGASVEGMQNSFARSFGHIGKIFLRTGLLGIGIMEGTHLLIGFAEQMITGGEEAERMKSEVAKLSGEMNKLAVEAIKANDSLAELAEQRKKLFSGELPAESAQEQLKRLTGLDPRIKDFYEQQYKRLADKEKAATKAQKDLEGDDETKIAEKQKLHDEQVATRVKFIQDHGQEYAGQLGMFSEGQVQGEIQRGGGWMDRMGKNRPNDPGRPETNQARIQARQRLLAEQLVAQDAQAQRDIRTKVDQGRADLDASIGKLDNSQLKAMSGHPQLSSAEDFGKKILELSGGGEKEGASEATLKMQLETLKKIQASIDASFNGGNTAVAKGGGGVQH